MLSLLRPLTLPARAILWFGALALLLVVLYPEFETSYYLLGGDLRLTGETHREFILNGHHGEWVETMPQFDARAARLLKTAERDNDMIIARGTHLKFWNMALQAGAVLALVIGALWVAKGRGLGV